jgi:hypothetical protein
VTDTTAQTQAGSAAASGRMLAATVLLAAAIVLSWPSMANADQSTMILVEAVDSA